MKREADTKRELSPFAKRIKRAIGNRDVGELEKELAFPRGVLEMVTSDEMWPNSVPVCHMLELLAYLEISTDEVSMLVKESLHYFDRDGRPMASLWECEEAVEKYLVRLRELVVDMRPSWKSEHYQYLEKCIEMANLAGLGPSEAQFVTAGKYSEGYLVVYWSDRQWDRHNRRWKKKMS